MLPNPDASARAEPVIPENIIEATTFTCPSAPFRFPTRAFANEKIMFVTLPEFMISAMNTKSGTAIRMKLAFMLVRNCMATMSSEAAGFFDNAK
jgi:hypothetical protein